MLRISLFTTLIAFVGACNNNPPPPDIDPVIPLPSTPLPDPGPPEVSDSSLAELCAGKPAPVGAAAYAKTAGKASPVGIYLADAGGEYSLEYSSVFSPWKADDAKDTQLVVCISRTGTKSSECRFDDDDDGSVHWLDLHDTKYAISIREASTGKELVEREVEVPSDGVCPMMWMFSDGERDSSYESYDTALLTMLNDLQPPDAPAPDLGLSSGTISIVCDGEGIPGAKKYEPTAGAISQVKLYERVGDGEWSGGTIYDLSIPDGWETNKFEDAQLVSCDTIERGDKIRSCKFDGGKVLDLHKATHTIVLREIATGKEVAQKKFEVKKASCPYIWGFDKGETSDVSHVTPQKGVDKWMKPHVAP